LKVLVVKKFKCAGDICAIVGVEGFEIGDTIADLKIQALKQLLLMSQQ
jgi:predicted membrane GTPase involved in stress response